MTRAELVANIRRILSGGVQASGRAPRKQKQADHRVVSVKKAGSAVRSIPAALVLPPRKRTPSKPPAFSPPRLSQAEIRECLRRGQKSADELNKQLHSVFQPPASNLRLGASTRIEAAPPPQTPRWLALELAAENP